jgi:hypothetical protein
MTISTVSIVALQSTGQALPNGRVTLQLTGLDIVGGLVAPEPVTVLLDASGMGSCSLIANASGTQGTQYRVTFFDADGQLQWNGLATIPATATCNLHDVLNLTPAPALSDALAAQIAAQAAATSAGISAAAAVNAAAVTAAASQGVPGATTSNLPEGSNLYFTDARAQAAVQPSLDGKQPLDGTLTAIAGVTVAADEMLYATGPDAFAAAPLTAAGRALLGDADAAAQRATLGLGGSAILNVGTAAGTVAAGDDARIVASQLAGHAAQRLFSGATDSTYVTGWTGGVPSSAAGLFTKDDTDTVTGALFTASAAPIPAPAAPTLSSVAGGTMAAIYYYVVVTYTTAAGETLASAEAVLSTASNNLLVVNSPPAQAGATGWNVYVSGAPGVEKRQNYAPLPIGTNWTEPTTGVVFIAPPPAANTAGSVLTISAVSSGSLSVGHSVNRSDTGATVGKIRSQLSGTAGAVGTYTLDTAVTISSMTMSADDDETYTVGFDGSRRKRVISAADLGLRARVLANATILRRGMNNKRVPSAERNFALAKATLDGAKKTTTGPYPGFAVWEPDGSGSYGAVWVRDMSMCMAGFLDYFGPSDILGAFTWYSKYVNTDNYWVPDHLAIDGTVYWTPGGSNDWGARAPTDGNTMLLQMAWLNFVKTGTADIYNANRTLLLGLLRDGIPYDSVTSCVYVDPNAPFTSWGFIDTVKLTGSVLFMSVLAYIGWCQLADMAYAAGDYGVAKYSLDRADAIKIGINSTLWTESSYVGMYKASTGLCSGQLDLWGSALAVYSGVASDGRAQMIASNFASNYSQVINGKPNFVFHGGVRHVFRNNDFSNDTQCWEASFVPVTYDSYQSGAYWTTPAAWVAHTLALVRPDVAADFVNQLRAEYNREDIFLTSTAPAEWWDYNLAIGVKLYCTSAVALMQIDATSLEERQQFAEYTINAITAIPNQAWTKIPFNTLVSDSIGSFDTANSAFVAPQTGLYLVGGSVRLDAPSGETEMLLRAVLNSTLSTGKIIADAQAATATPQALSLSGSSVMFLPKGTTVDLRVFCNVGTAATQYPVETMSDYTQFYVMPISAVNW